MSEWSNRARRDYMWDLPPNSNERAATSQQEIHVLVSKKEIKKQKLLYVT